VIQIFCLNFILFRYWVRAFSVFLCNPFWSFAVFFALFCSTFMYLVIKVLIKLIYSLIILHQLKLENPIININSSTTKSKIVCFEPKSKPLVRHLTSVFHLRAASCQIVYPVPDGPVFVHCQ